MFRGLSEADEIVIKDFESRQKYKWSFDSHIAEWRTCVELCEEGFDFNYNEYTNWLNYRDAIEEVILKLSSEGKKYYRGIVEPLDERFKKHTIQVNRKVWPEDVDYWWYYRIPKRIARKELEGFEHIARQSLKGKVEVF